MSTLQVTISDQQKAKFRINSANLSFDELLDLIEREQFRKSWEECIDAAEKTGLSNISMEEINEMVKEVRNEAKANT